MASDLPEMHRSPEAMARALVTYIADPVRVQESVRDQWGTAPCTYTISEMRRRHLKPPMPVEPYRPQEVYDPISEALGMEARSARFLDAIERERALSVERAKAQGALDSPSLRHPEIVNRAWDREIERAWLRSTELGR